MNMVVHEPAKKHKEISNESRRCDRNNRKRFKQI
jgi:hypothetical protein